MREIQASEAKTRLLALLDEVEAGETVVITRHGRAIARLVPETEHRREAVRQAIAALKEFRRTMPKMDWSELYDARHEGHKY
jgi:prevent-host-death family protein